jgi:hypothetical protein
MRLRTQEVDQFEVSGLAERLAPYELSRFKRPSAAEEVDSPLLETAVMLLRIMPPNQHRKTFANLLSPDDPQQGRRAVDALIEAALVTEDDQGHLHQTV